MVSLFISTLLWTLPASAQQETDWQTLVEAALDDTRQLSLTNIKLSDLIAVLKQETGVEVRMSPQVMAMLPHGGETLFTQAEFGNVPLRQGLLGLFAGLGMTLQVQGPHVEIVPKPGLVRIGRRATWDELDTLSRLSALQPGLNDADIEALRGRLQFRVPQREPWGVLSERLHEVGAGAGDEVLDIACAKLGWSWYPEGTKIVILPLTDQYVRQLQRVVMVRSQRRPFTEALDQVAAQCGVPISMDPGALAALSPESRQRFVFNSEGYSAGDVLQAIAAQARLTYVIGEEGVVFYDPASGSQRIAATSGASNGSGVRAGAGMEPGFGLVPVSIGGGPIIYLIVRESDLPPDVVRELQGRKADVVESIRSSLKRP